MNTMTYKNYAARIEFDPEDRIFVGHLAGVRDIVGFHGRSVSELERAFHAAVNDYLSACEKLGQKPERPASGKLLLRMDPAEHTAAIRAAELAGKSVNQWARDALHEAALSDR
ncbi:MAG TPA: type II toxin-antitoxin system HicB family antitoxin [Oleiagrimonas sp.]|nr:type II toxin-antitoxin system HicB family antitoxin [Oleiagrimonas sp.]